MLIVKYLCLPSLHVIVHGDKAQNSSFFKLIIRKRQRESRRERERESYRSRGRAESREKKIELKNQKDYVTVGTITVSDTESS